MSALPLGAGAAAGWLVDRLLGEPPTRFHPVAWFGSTMTRLEAFTYGDNRASGVRHLAAGAGVAVGAGLALRRLIGPGVATAVAAYVSIAGKMLADEAGAVLSAIERGDLETARERLPTLVGRDVTGLSAGEITRATIESVAENTVDAVTAPLFWAAVAGAPGVLAHRAVNTLDAMIGHRDDRHERFGWASARADDVLNWLPARLGAVGLMALAPRRAASIRHAIAHDARHHPSPNAGVIEAAFAAALGIRLGGINRYRGRLDDRGQLGDGPPPEPADARRAIRLAHRLGVATSVTVAGAAIAAARTRGTRRCRSA
jgi:adenosylcobinamide-phosphate synthase